MRIRVVRSGGFAGLRVEREVDSERLPEAERLEFARLVAEARVLELPPHDVSGLPDVVVYHIRVETDLGAHELLVDDRTAGAPLFALIERVLREPR